MELGLVPFREIVTQRRLGFLFYILNQNKNSMINRVFESQRRNKTKKDWVTTVLSDLEVLKWNINLDDIKKSNGKEYVIDLPHTQFPIFVNIRVEYVMNKYFWWLKRKPGTKPKKYIILLVSLL